MSCSKEGTEEALPLIRLVVRIGPRTYTLANNNQCACACVCVCVCVCLCVRLLGMIMSIEVLIKHLVSL